MKTNEFFAAHPVFSLDEASIALGLPGGRAGTVERLKYHLETGRLKLVIRGVYAVVPPGGKAEEFRPDLFLVAAAFRPKGIFSHHKGRRRGGAGRAGDKELIVMVTLRSLAVAQTLEAFGGTKGETVPCNLGFPGALSVLWKPAPFRHGRHARASVSLPDAKESRTSVLRRTRRKHQTRRRT